MSELRIRKAGIKAFTAKDRQVQRWVRASKMVDDDEYHVTEGPFATLQELTERSSPALINHGKTGYDVALRLPIGAQNPPVIELYWHPEMNKWVTQIEQTGGAFGAFILSSGTTQEGDQFTLDFPGIMKFNIVWFTAGATNFSPGEDGYTFGLWTINVNTVNEGSSEALATLFGVLNSLPALFKNVQSDFATFFTFELVDFFGVTYTWDRVNGAVWDDDVLVTKFPQTRLIREVQP